MHPFDPQLASAQWSKMSFRAAYCQKRNCADDAYDRRVFWEVIYPHARLFAFLIGARADFFSSDRGLINYCGRLTSLKAIEKELVEFASLQN